MKVFVHIENSQTSAFCLHVPYGELRGFEPDDDFLLEKITAHYDALHLGTDAPKITLRRTFAFPTGDRLFVFKQEGNLNELDPLRNEVSPIYDESELTARTIYESSPDPRISCEVPSKITLNRLILKMTEPNSPWKICDIFFMMFTEFTTDAGPRVVLEKLIQRYDVPFRLKHSDQDKEYFLQNILYPIRRKVLTVFRFWLENFPRADYWKNDVCLPTRLLEWLQQVVLQRDGMSIMAAELKALVEVTCQEALYLSKASNSTSASPSPPLLSESALKGRGNSAENGHDDDFGDTASESSPPLRPRSAGSQTSSAGAAAVEIGLSFSGEIHRGHSMISSSSSFVQSSSVTEQPWVKEDEDFDRTILELDDHYSSEDEGSSTGRGSKKRVGSFMSEGSNDSASDAASTGGRAARASTMAPMRTKSSLGGAIRKMTLRSSRKTSGNDPKILQFTPLEIASQLTLMAASDLDTIQASEFLKQAWNKEKYHSRAPNIRQFINQFNRLCNFVSATILTAEDPQIRLRCVRHWVAVQEQFRSLQNFDGLLAVSTGLDATPVRRLIEELKLPDDVVALRSEYMRFMSTDGNYKLYREALSAARAPAIPFMGMTLRNYIFCDDGNPTYMKGVVNFMKFVRLYVIVTGVLRFQPAEKWYMKRACLEENTDLRMLMVMHRTMSEDEMFQHSYRIKPRKAKV